jgi:hypothetical protein
VLKQPRRLDVKGYEVVTSDGQKIGRVTQVLDGFLVVELGRVLRSRRPLPKEFAHAQDRERTVVVTVPRRVLGDAPRVDRSGTFDVDEAAQHYGLASSYLHAGRQVVQPVKARLAEGGEQRLAVCALVVPGESQLAHQVRACGLEPLVAGEGGGDAVHAPLAADPADLDRLALKHCLEG